MGDQYAVKSFLSAYEGPTNTWNMQHCYDMQLNDASFFHCDIPFLHGQCEAWNYPVVDISLTKFADDLTKFVLANTPHDATDKRTMLQLLWDPCEDSLGRFDEIMAEHGFAQNREKLICIISLLGAGSRRAIAQISSGAAGALPFKCALTTRSLGSLISAECRAQPEVDARVAAVRKASFRHGRIWTKSAIPWKTK